MKRFAVIGNPISHSLSPLIHNFLFSHFAISAFYEKIRLGHSDALKSTLFALHGANITSPYKEKAYSLCDEIRGIAQEIGAINTIFQNNEQLIGCNTDALGFWECVKDLEIHNALILGAGGSAKAMAVILQTQGVEVEVYARNPKRHLFFTQRQIKVQQELDLQPYDLIINATSAGLMGQLPLKEELLGALLIQCQYAFDVIYASSSAVKTIQDFRVFLKARPPTLFASYAKQYCSAVDGLAMLLYQALLAFEVFCERKYDFEELKALFYNV